MSYIHENSYKTPYKAVKILEIVTFLARYNFYWDT